MAAPKKNNFYLLGLSTTGRPPKYKKASEMQVKINEYFELCIKSRAHAKITELALYLGFESRVSLDDYCKRSKDFSYVIKRAKTFVESGYETLLQNGVTSAIFALKNMGWADKQQFDHTTAGEPINAPDLGNLTFEQLMEYKHGKAQDTQG